MTRTEIIDFLNSKETYDRVLEIIQDKGGDELSHQPLYGFIAGGSIANTIHHILNNTVQPVINDIDVFCLDNSESLYFHQIGENNFIDEFTGVGINQDGYGVTYLGPQGERISMYNSERFGVVNKVSIRVSNHRLGTIPNFNPVNYYNEVLNQFDINCCSAGIDRVNNKIVYTENFVYFLLKNKIEVITLHTPIKSFIRLHNKIKDLNCECDLENEIKLLKHGFICSDMFDRRFGDEWYEKINNNLEIVTEHFEVTAQKNDKSLVQLIFDIGGVNKNIYRYQPKKFRIEDFAFVFSRNYFNKAGLMVLWDIMVRDKNPEKKVIIREFLNKFKQKNIEGFTSELNIQYSGNFDFYNECIFSGDVNINMSSMFPFKKLNFFEVIGLIPGYLDKEFSCDDLEKIESFHLESHSLELSSFFVDNVKDHLETLIGVTKMFYNKKEDQLDVTTLIKCIRRFNKIDRKNFNTFSKELKLEALKKSLNSIWIKDCNYFPKFKIKKEY